MRLPLWTVILVTLTSPYLKSVRSQNATAQPVCCPAYAHRNGVHVYCMDKSLRSFAWAKKAAVWFDPKTEEACVKGSSKSGTPSDISSVVWLDLSHNLLTSLPEISHGSLASLYHLNLSHNQMLEVSIDAFLSVQRLQYLDLSFNRLSFVPDFSQDHLPGLTFLDLSYNFLHEIPGHAFRGLSKLETLIVSHNKIGEVASVSFADLSSLKLLVFRSNIIENFPPGVFDELSHLIDLDLSSNVLASLPKNSLRNLSQLKLLNLSDNSLNEVPLGALRKLSGLRTLDLSKNQITNISGGLFEDLEKLERLKLTHNKVKAVSVDTFKGLKGLKILDLSHNQLATIRKASFTHTKSLNRMTLKSNALKRLHEHVFAGLQWLEVLDLSDNQLQLDLETLPEDLFTPLQRLTSLDLHGNDLRTEGTYPSNVFKSLVSLRHLSIDTFSTTVFGQGFSALSHLRKLDLPHCKMTSLTEDTFQGLRQSGLGQLSLSACPLHRVEECAFCGLQNLERLTITDSSLPSPVVIQGKLLDLSTTGLRHLNLSNMNLESHTLQAVADHTLENLDHLEVLDLSRNKLTDMNITLKGGRLRQLLLSGNRFQTMPVNLTSFRRLVLLDISGNNISNLSRSQRESLDKLADTSEFTLRLHGNQLVCPPEDCRTVDFLAWMCSTKVRFDDGQTAGREYPCATNGGRTVMTTVEDAHTACTRWPVGPLAFCFLLLVLVVSCLVTGSPRQKNQRPVGLMELQSEEIMPDSSFDSGSSSSGVSTLGPFNSGYNGQLSLSSNVCHPEGPTRNSDSFLNNGSSFSDDHIMNPTDCGFSSFSTLSSTVSQPQIPTQTSDSPPPRSSDETQPLRKQYRSALQFVVHEDDSSVFLSQIPLMSEAERNDSLELYSSHVPNGSRVSNASPVSDDRSIDNTRRSPSTVSEVSSVQNRSRTQDHHGTRNTERTERKRPETLTSYNSSQSLFGTSADSLQEDRDSYNLDERMHHTERKRPLHSQPEEFPSTVVSSAVTVRLERLGSGDQYSHTRDAEEFPRSGIESFMDRYNQKHQTSRKELSAMAAERERQVTKSVTLDSRSDLPMARVLPLINSQSLPRQSHGNEPFYGLYVTSPPPSYNTACQEPVMTHRVKTIIISQKEKQA